MTAHTKDGNRAGRPPRPHWTAADYAVLEEVYPTLGAAAVAKQLGRSIEAVHQKGWARGLKDPTLPPPAAKRRPLNLEQEKRADELNREGWGCERIGKLFGVSEGTVMNALLRRRCHAAGGRPARRDANGNLLATEVKRMRALMMEGRKNVEIALLMAVSQVNVSLQRRKYEAELKERRKGKTLPPIGGGQAYSGAKVPRAKRLEVEALYMTGLGTKKVSAATGVSHTTCGRIRNRLIKRLARKGECLPGCDRAGVRHVQTGSARFIPPAAIAELRRRILDRWPVIQAARDLAIGGSSAYRIRDELAAELATRGETLPAPIRRGSGAEARRDAQAAKWLPPGAKHIYRFRALVAEHGAAEGRRIMQAEIAAAVGAAAELQRAEAARPLSFEQQLERARAGARLEQRLILHKPAPDMTLGGIATGAL